MNTRLQFIFNDMDIKSVIEILNPPTIPCNGELISFDWPSYISNKRDLNLIARHLETNGFRALVLSKHFAPEEVQIKVILIKDVDYEETNPGEGAISAGYLHKCMLDLTQSV
jgi:hypothetical protein